MAQEVNRFNWHANVQPEHIHAGDFSWVIYCKVPEGLKEEREN